ncbi:MAG: secretin N-terminal domain-containing protein [Pirellula sp.]
MSTAPLFQIGQLCGQSQLPPPNQAFQLPPASNSNTQQIINPMAAGATSDARLQAYDVPLENVGQVAAKLQMQFGADKRVRITNEPNSGRLMVLAPEATQRQIAQAVEAVRKQVGSLSRDARGNIIPSTIQQNQYKLQRITWRELEDAVGRLAGPKLTITTLNNGELAQLKLVSKDSVQDVMLVDRRNDAVRLQGTPTNVMAWTQVVTAIDMGQADPNRPTQIVPISPATPERIERAIKLVRYATYQQPGQRPVEEDEATSVQRLGQENAPTTLLQSQDGLASSGLIGDVEISFVPEMGLVIIKGSKKDVQRVNEVIEQIKKQSIETAPDIQLKMLKHVNSQALETIVRNLNTEVYAPRQGSVSITALGQPNALLLIGRKEALTAIVELIDQLDQPTDPSSASRVFRLLHASALDAVTLIQAAFPDTATTGGAANQTTTLAPRVKVVADYRTNSLIVIASPRDLNQVAGIIQSIDVDEAPSAESELKIFPLRFAVAADIQPILNTAITGEQSATTPGQPGGGGGQQRQQQGGAGASSASIPNSRISLSKDGSIVNSGILSGVVITNNPSTNALIVRAPAKSMALIAALINQLDVPPSVEAKIKVFEIKNGDASSLVTTLQQALGLPTTQTNQANTGGAFGGLFGFQNLGALSAGGDNSLVPIRIAAETRTNSIIVSGSDTDLQLIETLIIRLDEDNARQRLTEVIWLRNSNALDVQTAVNQLITSQRTALTAIQPVQQAGINAGQVFSVNERIDREIFVVAEPATNSLIVSAMPRFMPMIREVIERLDRQMPMISVEILVAEVTLEDNFDLGAEFGLQDSLLFDRNSATGGTLNSPVFNLGTGLTAANNRRPDNVGGQAFSGFGLGRTNANLNYGGLVLAASNESVGMLFRALQDANRIQILSRPRLMTIDNNIGVVSVGQSVPRIQGSTLGVTGTQQSIGEVPVGLIMQIQPRTNQDGLINMIVSVNRSSLGDINDGVPVAFGPNGETIFSPIINQTLTQTRVTAYDGQTVVLSGLITKNRTSRSRRVPFLADIPIAGALFRFDSESEIRTELLVVMTPRIINYNDDQKLEMIKQVESSRMSWCLADVLNIHGDHGLSPGNGLWGPAASPVIYPDLQPTVDSPRRNGPPSSMNIGQPELMNSPGTEMLDGYPINAPVRSNSDAGRTLLNASEYNDQPSVNSASPIQNSTYLQGNQYPQGAQGGYNGVAPASYRPSAPTARVANGR